MTDEPALLAAVAAHPDDDTPRLVYADWLDDHGRPVRAEFIRLQCRLAAATPADDDYPELLDRQDELAWWLNAFDPLPPVTPEDNLIGDSRDSEAIPGSTGTPESTREPILQVAHSWMYGWGSDDIRRGFPDCMYGMIYEEWNPCVGWSPPDFGRFLDALGKHLPTSQARSLRVWDLTTDQSVELIRRPFAADLRGLCFTGPDSRYFRYYEGRFDPQLPLCRSGLAVAEAITTSPHLKNLIRLDFGTDLTAEAAAVLAGADLPNLAELRLGNSEAAPWALAPLATAGWFQNLRVLTLDGGSDGWVPRSIGVIPPMPRLHTLSLREQLFDPFETWGVAESRSFPALAALHIRCDELGDEGVGYLGSADWSARELKLYCGGLTDADVFTLLSGRLLDGVRVLDLSADLSDHAAVALAASPKLRELRHLKLGTERIGPDGFAALGKSPNFRHLTRLDLGTCGDEADRAPVADLAALLSNLDAPNLRRLTLANRPVGATGAELLASRPTFANLRMLDLSNCQIGNAELATLASSRQLRGLVKLNLHGNQLTDAAAILVPAMFPRLALCYLRGNALPEVQIKSLRALGPVIYTDDLPDDLT